jgi:hypothetical protein
MASQVELDEELLDKLANKLADSLDDEIKHTKKHRETKSSFFSIIVKLFTFLLLLSVPLVGLPIFVYTVARDSSWYCGNCHADTLLFSKFCKNCYCEYV